MATKAVTDASFQADVLDSDTPVLVDFWADWCTPCKMIAPALEEISDELAGQLTIAKMDIMANPDVPTQTGVQSIPLMVLYKNGQLLADLLERRGDHLARAAPLCPEVDQHRGFGIEDVGLEAGIGDGLGGHGECS